ncbi:unnamed protein product [Polarella glacialis]|uniref:Uncharacterized protein n=1 Tax=Polarella glacialis TaxID=89957 RepID=A0A813D7H6_POLGL|nr:unnamed protein product [Polarella glacialis]
MAAFTVLSASLLTCMVLLIVVNVLFAIKDVRPYLSKIRLPATHGLTVFFSACNLCAKPRKAFSDQDDRCSFAEALIRQKLDERHFELMSRSLLAISVGLGIWVAFVFLRTIKGSPRFMATTHDVFLTMAYALILLGIRCKTLLHSKWAQTALYSGMWCAVIGFFIPSFFDEEYFIWTYVVICTIRTTLNGLINSVKVVVFWNVAFSLAVIACTDFAIPALISACPLQKNGPQFPKVSRWELVVCVLNICGIWWTSHARY